MTARPATGTGRLVRERWDVLLVIAAGGAVGSIARWAVAVSVPHAPAALPWATWLTNVSGAFALGLLMVLVLDYWPPSRYVRPFVGVGVLGGYTTYSTYMLDTGTLLGHGQVPAAFAYLVGTLLAGLAAVWAGVLCARWAVTAMERRHRHRPGGDPEAPSAPARDQPSAGEGADTDPDTDPNAASRSRR